MIEYEKQHQNEKTIKSCFCLKRRAPLAQQPNRVLIFGQRDISVSRNKIQTAKYNYLNFFPKNLLVQFSKAPNLYFILIGILQIIPQTTTTQGIPLNYLPLSFIIIVSMIKDFVEDKRRRDADLKDNQQIILKFVEKNGIKEFNGTQSKLLCIGDIIKIEENQYFPSDLLMIYCPNELGICHLETKSLDGETNQKQTLMLPLFKKLFESESDIYQKNLKSKIFYEKPNPNIHHFQGYLEDEQQVKHVLNSDHFIKRGSQLVNTKYCIGVILYTGHDTKIMLNSLGGQYKFSDLEKKMNQYIIHVFALLILLILYCSTCYALKTHQNLNNLTYLKLDNLYNYYDKSKAQSLFFRIPMWLLLLNNLIPISLLVTVELIKFIQAILIMIDKNFYCNKIKMYASVNSSNLNDELGLVNYIFTDKTGTLTSNQMKFKSLNIGQICYGNSSNAENNNPINQKKSENQSIQQNQEENKTILNKNIDFEDENFLIHGGQSEHPNFLKILDTMICMNVCNTIHVQKREEKFLYNSQSPDEFAFVNFTQEMKFQFIGLKDSVYQILDTRNSADSKLNLIELEQLALFKFTYERKRMSVIIKNQSNEIILYCKGADQVIMPLLAKGQEEQVEISQNHLQMYSKRGFRTLCLSKKIIDAAFFESWQEKYSQIETSFQNQRVQFLEEMQDQLETDLELLAVTAIEDQLQEEVSETITDLKQAGIKIWMMTGDKIETAVNIGLSCNLISENSKIVILDKQSKEQLEAELEENLKIFQNNSLQLISLVISGSCFQEIYSHEGKLFEMFCTLSYYCSTIIGARISPKEKQMFVEIVRKRHPDQITLAIGDGANDVSMLTAAHIGVGIQGIEGLEAAKAGDFAFAKFKFLKRILFYTGYEIQRKNSEMVYYNFYKNFINRLPYFWFGIWNMYSATDFYDPYAQIVFNLIFTSLPIIIYSIFDEIFPSNEYLELAKSKPNQLEKMPHLYKAQMKFKFFNLKKLYIHIFLGFVHSLFIFIISFQCLPLGNSQQIGAEYDLHYFGMVIFTATVFMSNFKVYLLHFTHHGVSLIINLISTLAYFLYLYIVSKVLKSIQATYQFNKLFGEPVVYLIVIICLSFIFVLEYFVEKFYCFFQENWLNHVKTNKIANSSQTQQISKSNTVFGKTSVSYNNLQDNNNSELIIQKKMEDNNNLNQIK